MLIITVESNKKLYIFIRIDVSLALFLSETEFINLQQKSIAINIHMYILSISCQLLINFVGFHTIQNMILLPKCFST